MNNRYCTAQSFQGSLSHDILPIPIECKQNICWVWYTEKFQKLGFCWLFEMEKGTPKLLVFSPQSETSVKVKFLIHSSHHSNSYFFSVVTASLFCHNINWLWQLRGAFLGTLSWINPALACPRFYPPTNLQNKIFRAGFYIGCCISANISKKKCNSILALICMRQLDQVHFELGLTVSVCCWLISV